MIHCKIRVSAIIHNKPFHGGEMKIAGSSACCLYVGLLNVVADNRTFPKKHKPNVEVCRQLTLLITPSSPTVVMTKT